MAIYRTLVKKISVPSDMKIKRKDYKEKGLLAIVDQGQQLIGGYSDITEKRIKCELPVLVFGDHTRIVKYIDFPFCAGADGTKILQAKANVLPKYLYFGTLYLVLTMSDRGYARHYQYIEKMDLPVPTYEEQERVVCQIEELFSKIDEGVEVLQKVKQQLAVYRQAVLKEAFNETANGKKSTIMAVCEKVVDCPHSTPKWEKSGKLCLRTTNFKRGYLDLREKNYVSKETFDARNKRLIPKAGDILFSREGAILGIACIIPEEIEVCLGQRMMLLRSKKSINNKFLMYYLNSPMVNKLVIQNIGGTASPHINVGDIKEFLIPTLDMSSQLDIVREIEARLSVCDNIEKTVEIALQQAEAMRQGILKSVFEGGFHHER